MKKSYQLELQDGSNNIIIMKTKTVVQRTLYPIILTKPCVAFFSDIIKGTVRGCTPQKYDYQIYKNGKWRTESAMEYDSYRKGCVSGNDELRTPDTTFCYCDDNLCNNAKQTTNFSSHTDTIAVIIIYNIMKVLNTHTQPA